MKTKEDFKNEDYFDEDLELKHEILEDPNDDLEFSINVNHPLKVETIEDEEDIRINAKKRKIKKRKSKKKTVKSEENFDEFDISFDEDDDFNQNQHKVKKPMTKKQILCYLDEKLSVKPSGLSNYNHLRKQKADGEIDLLNNLLQQYGIHEMDNNDPRRSESWELVTEQYNITTGENKTAKQLRDKMSNYNCKWGPKFEKYHFAFGKGPFLKQYRHESIEFPRE